MSSFKKRLGRRIKVARKKAGLSQEQLAGLCGIEQKTVSKYETGTNAPLMEIFIKISIHAPVKGATASIWNRRTDDEENNNG